MTDQPTETNEERISRIAATAKDADGDTEAAIQQLQALAAARRKDPVVEQRYEGLRNQLARQLGREGARWFLDESGNKWLAYTVAPENTFLDVEEAERMAKEGKLDQETLELIAPRKQNLTGLAVAIRAGTKVPPGPNALTPAQVQRLISFEPGTPYVQFAQPGSDDEE